MSVLSFSAIKASFNSLIAAAVVSPEVDERAAAYEDLWQVAVAEQALWTPLWHNVSISFTTEAVNGYELNLLGKGQIQFAWLEG